MQHHATPSAAACRRRDRLGLPLATLLSLVLHALIAGGLVTTGLGILSTPRADTSTDVPAILRPSVKVDFPLEVSRSGADIAAHENPLSLPTPKQQAAARSQDHARTVSPTKPIEPAEQTAPKPLAPERSAASPNEQIEMARRLDRADLRATDQAAPPPSLPAVTDSTPAARSTATPQPRSLPTPDVAQPIVAARAPREVAMLPAIKPSRTPASRPSDAAAPDAPAPRTSRLSRQAPASRTSSEPSTRADTLRVETPTSESKPAQPRAEPRSTRSPWSSESGVARGPTVRTAPATDADAVDPIAAAAQPRATASAASNERADPVGPMSAEPESRRPTRALPGVAAAIATGDAAAAVPLPAGGAAAAGSATSGGDPIAAAVPRPGAPRGVEGRYRGASGVATRSPATNADDGFGQSDDSPDADLPPQVSGGLSSLAVNGSRAGGSGTLTDGNTQAFEGGPSAPPARSRSIGDAGSDAGPVTVAPLADAGSAGTGAGEARPADGGDDGVSVVARPTAPSFRGRGAGAGSPRSAMSRGVAASAPVSEADVASDRGHDDDGLSTDGVAGIVGSLGMASGRRTPGDDQAIGPTAPLQRVTAVVLPTESRVRDIAPPFKKRARENRSARRTDGVVERGLDFLRRAQQEDGRWRLAAYPGADRDSPPKLSSDTAATGLALLSFLGAGHDHFDGPHRDTVRRGLEFLLSVQKDDGDLYLPADPLSNSCAWLYSHAIATMALCEAVGMTGDPRIRPAAERACRFIAASQHPDRGGWRYTPRSDADLSVSGWMLVALRSGELAGIAVDRPTMQRVGILLDASAIAPESARTPMARFHYNARKPEQRPSDMSTACMNALGTLMRLHTGWSTTDSRVIEHATSLATMPPTYGTAAEKSRDAYLWYYVSQVLVHTGGEPWDTWYATLADTLGPRQQADGPLAGSWDPLGPTPDRWGPYGGRIYVTALHLLTLEVPDRHLPTYSFAHEAPP